MEGGAPGNVRIQIPNYAIRSRASVYTACVSATVVFGDYCAPFLIVGVIRTFRDLKRFAASVAATAAKCTRFLTVSFRRRAARCVRSARSYHYCYTCSSRRTPTISYRWTSTVSIIFVRFIFLTLSRDRNVEFFFSPLPFSRSSLLFHRDRHDDESKTGCRLVFTTFVSINRRSPRRFFFLGRGTRTGRFFIFSTFTTIQKLTGFIPGI